MEKRRLRSDIDSEIILTYVKMIRKQQPRIGTRKLYSLLQDVLESNGIKCGRDKLFALLRNNDLLVKRRRRRIHTTDSDHAFKKYPNLIKDYAPNGPEQIWVSDITYLSTKCGFAYLSLVTDQYSKRIMGHHISDTLEAKGPLKALKMAFINRTHPGSNLIHHSDRGIQYCCKDYIGLLERNGIVVSMSSKGNPYENAVAERVNGVLKSEFYLDRLFENHTQVRLIVKEVIKTYNTQRPHASCDYLTPEKAHVQYGKLKKRWQDYKPKKISQEVEPIREEVKRVLDQLTKRCAESALSAP